MFHCLAFTWPWLSFPGAAGDVCQLPYPRARMWESMQICVADLMSGGFRWGAQDLIVPVAQAPEPPVPD